MNRIIGDVISDDLFKKLRKAFQQRNEAIGSRGRIVIFVRFRNDNNKSLSPEERVI